MVMNTKKTILPIEYWNSGKTRCIEDKDEIIILEDDAELDNDFVSSYNKLISDTESINWDFLYLGRKKIGEDKNERNQKSKNDSKIFGFAS